MRQQTVSLEPPQGSSRRRYDLSCRNAPVWRAPVPVPSAAIELLEPLARRSVTEIWRARAVSDGATCVVKRVAPSYAGHRGAQRLVEREHEFLSAACGDGVVRTMGLVALDRGPGVVLEYLPGGDLVALAGAHPRYWAEAARDVAAALLRLHARGIVHRDVKPRNVLLDAAGGAQLIDFGSAQRAGAPTPAGGTTAGYRRAPAAATVGPAEDVDAFAALLFELLAGRPPFGADDTGKRPATCASASLGSPVRDRGPDVAALARATTAALERSAQEPAPTLEVFREMLNTMAER